MIKKNKHSFLQSLISNNIKMYIIQKIMEDTIYRNGFHFDTSSSIKNIN